MRTRPALVLMMGSLLMPVWASAANELPRSTPEAQGVASEAIAKFVDEADRKVDAMHSFMLVRHGHVVAEGWWEPYSAEQRHMMFSLSKSFTSTAVGLAIAEGKLSLDDRVLPFFPDETPAEPSRNLQAMRVRDLLTMSTGHHEETIRGFPFQSQENLVAKFLALPVDHKPGTFFVYNTPATYMLSAIVQKATGETVLDYLQPRLFEPLGIENPDWPASAQGVTLGGFGLSVRTEDIAKFGQLYLDKGKWNGRQLVPAQWVEQATARQMSNGSDPNSDWEQGYGFQFWRSRHNLYRGDGAHGQFCLVFPEHDAVVAITSGTANMGQVMNLVWQHILPALRKGALPENRPAQEALKARLAKLSLPTQTGEATSSRAAGLAGKTFVFPQNRHGIETLTWEVPVADGQVLKITVGGVEQRVVAPHGRWQKGDLKMATFSEPVVTSGAWTADDTYALKVVRYQGPFTHVYRLRFAGDEVTLEGEQNVGFGPGQPPAVVGRLRR
jgi:Beta-lactamase class C and other penicillin binding proteins